MFARLIGIALGAVLAFGATAVASPDSWPAETIRSVQQEQPKGDAAR